MRLVFPVMAVALALVAVPAAAEEVKIGVVDLEQALSSTEEGKAAKEELERKAREAEAKLQPMVDRARALQEEIKSKKFVLSDEALRQKNLDLVELMNQIESKKQELEGKFKVDQERIVGPLRKKLIEIVRAVGKENGFTLVIDRNTPGLLYTREAIDITELVIEKFNKKG